MNLAIAGRGDARRLALRPRGARWYNPLHLAKLKPHEMARGAARTQGAARAPPVAGAPDAPAPPAAGSSAESAGGAGGIRAASASSAGGVPDGGASFAAARAPSEALTLADLIKMQLAGVERPLPPAFFKHANAVRTCVAAPC